MSRDLYGKILAASEAIHKSSIKGSANYIVSSPSVANMIQKVYDEQRSNLRKEKIIKIYE